MLFIIQMIDENGSVNNVEIRPAIGKSKPTAPTTTRLLAKMCAEGMLIPEGAGRATRWLCEILSVKGGLP